MTLAVWFWVILVIALLFGAWGALRPDPNNHWRGAGLGLIQIILFVILGIAAFGGPVK